MKSDPCLTIGQLAKQSGVNVETIRYYQRINLIEEPLKPIKGYRKYSQDLIKTIKFIKRAQQLGFTLSEINELIILGQNKCHDVKSLAIAKRSKIIEQIVDLKAMKKELNRLIDACDETENTPHCALIETLANTS